MPPPPLFDTSTLNLDKILFSRDQIYAELPHRHEFKQLDAIIHLNSDKAEAAALRRINQDEFWVRGHIPGRPLLPGVLMMESAAHLASFVASRLIDFGDRFIGLGGVDKFKFRGSVTPNAEMLILAKLIEAKTRRVICAAQGFVEEQMVFEGQIVGMPI